MKRFVRIFVSLAVAAIFVLLPSAPVNAQSNALSINPRKDYNAKPGDTINDTITLTNLNKDVPLYLQLKVVDFTSSGETGAPKLIQKSDAPPTAWSLRGMLTVAQQLTIDAAKSATIPISLKVPAKQGAGSYYSAIEYSVVTGGSEKQVTVAAAGTTLVFLNVPGTAREQLQFVQFGAFVPNKDDTSGAFSGLFVAHKPQILAYRLNNQGNIAEVPQGAITIKDMFGKTYKQINDANPKKQIVLLGQTRRFEVCMNPSTQNTNEDGSEVQQTVCKDPNLKPGRYTAQLSLIYGSNGNETREITAATSFWYLPWWFIVAFLLVLALIIGIVFFIVRKIRDLRDVHSRRGRR